MLKPLRHSEVGLENSEGPPHLSTGNQTLEPNTKLSPAGVECQETRCFRKFNRRFVPEFKFQYLPQCTTPAAFPNLTIEPGVVQDFTV
jgi:hypothetical protein